MSYDGRGLAWTAIAMGRLSMKSLRALGAVLAGCLLVSCGNTTGSGGDARTGSTSQALNTSPVIGNFLLYAERSIKLGVGDIALAGDVGVHAAAPSSFGSQVVVSQLASVDHVHNILGPSVSLGLLSTVGDVQTNSLTNNGAALGQLGPFPASSMPPLPLATATGSGGSNVNVPALTITTLQPGSYGALTVTGTVLLNAGAYTFTSVTMANSSHLGVVSGAATVSVAGTFTAGTYASIASAGLQPAGQLAISVAGSDSGSSPAFSVGDHGAISALLSAPHGTLSLGASVIATGAFAGFDVAVGAASTLTYQSGFSPSPKGQQQLTGYVNPAVASAPLVGPVAPSTPVSLSFGLPVPNLQALQTFIRSVSDPTSSTYRHFLSVADFATMYGPHADAYGRLSTWAQARGLGVTSSFANNMVLAVQGTAASVEQALHVNLNDYLRPDGSQFYSLDRDPSLDLADAVLAIQGLDNFVLPRAGILQNGIMMGNDFNVAYDGPYGSVSCGSQTGLYGSGQSIGIFSFLPQVLPSGHPLGAGFYASDINSYVQDSHTNSESSVFLGITPPAPIAVPVGAPMSATTPPSGADTTETSMDIEMAYSMAPQAQIYVFEGSNANDILSAMATQAGSATPHINQLTTSWNQCDDQETQQILYEFAAQGQSFFISSGDTGAYPEDPSIYFNCRSNQFDTTDLDSATLVGGTQLTLQGPSSNFPVDASPEAWSSEVSWSCPSGASECSGGGILTTRPLPNYQAGLSSSNSQASSSHRNVPDVAMVATNVADYCNLGVKKNSGGTSAASPLWAGYMALVNEKNASNGTTIGFANPAIYAIGGDATAYAAGFHDISDGQKNQSTTSNGVSYSAVAGYDLVTGWGSPTCQLIDKLACATTCGTSLCVDLDTSAKNCGVCGHDCLGGTCSGGICQPMTLAALSGSEAPGIAVDATNVYWTDQGTGTNFTGFLKSVPKAGGTVVTLASSLTVPVLATVGGGNVFWSAGADPGGDAIFSIPSAGGTASTLVNDNNVVDIVADNNNVYWVDQSNGVQQAPVAGGTPKVLAPTQGSGSAIATDGTNVYWADGASFSSMTIAKVPIGGTSVTKLTSGLGFISPGGLATDGTNVYWIETNPSGTARIGSVPVAGGSPTTSSLTAPPLTGGAVIAVDSSNFYWAVYGSGSLMRAQLPVSNANPGTVMASTSVVSEQLVVDATAVYWNSSTGVMKVAK
jgi:hypothetical protein